MIIDIDPRMDIVFHNLFGSPEHPKLFYYYRSSQWQVDQRKSIDNTNYSWHVLTCH